MRTGVGKALKPEIVNSVSALTAVAAKMARDFTKHHYLRVVWYTSRDRTLEQNRLWAALYQRISDILGDGTAADIAQHKAYCKLMVGVPILRRDNEEFEKGWKRYFDCRSYEEQLFLMGPNPLFGVDGFPVTRLFNTKQGAEYTNEIARHYAPQSVFFGDLLDGK